MKKTLLFALALVAVGCTDAGQSDLCVGPSRFGLLAFYGGPLEDVRTCAEEGIASAQFELGYRYRIGLDVPRDYAEARHWYRLAAEQGHASAQSGLGRMYHNGDGVPLDYAESARWYRLAADQGYSSSQDALGRMYGLGEGVPRDYVLAYMWLNLAASQENGEDSQVSSATSQDRRDIVAEMMTPAQIAEAQRLSTEWVEAHPPGGN